MMIPRAASKPPQKLSGAARRNGSPLALPLSTVRAGNDSLIEDHQAPNCGPYAFCQAAKREAHVYVGWRIVRHLARIGHHNAFELLNNRCDVGTSVGHDANPARLKALQAAVPLKLPQHEAAGVDVER